LDRKFRQKLEGLQKVVLYALSRAPDEFGLLPDPEGYVSLKDLVKALSEEPDWPHIRLSHLQEIRIHDLRGEFEIRDGRMRATTREASAGSYEIVAAPKLLYIALRPRSWPHVTEQGLRPFTGAWVVLSRDKELALRIGRRKDPEPILVEVHAERAQSQGVSFFAAGRHLVVAPYVPCNFLNGPPVEPQELRQTTGSEQPKKNSAVLRDLPGSFFLNPDRDLPSRPKPGASRTSLKSKGGGATDKRSRREARDLKKGRR